MRGIRHPFTSAKADGGDATLVRPSNWNAAHVGFQYPSLKPATPTYDFDDSALDGAFSAHSSQGSFTTAHCMTQGEAWMASSLEMQFSQQMGALYVSHANTDFDFSFGGIRKFGFGSAPVMYGIAALNSSGTGVGNLVYVDGNTYFASVTTWEYVSNSDSWGGQGSTSTQGAVDGDWWVRMTRVGSTWTGYVSRSGRAWDKVYSTRSDSITVDRLAIGLFYDTGTAYSGRLIADYLQVDV